VMLPHGVGQSIYPFLADYGSLSVWEKLIVYPTYSGLKSGVFGDLFLKDNPEGNFAISAPDYYTAVGAVHEEYFDKPAVWLSRRLTFVQLLHVAYAVAIGRRPRNPRPLMVYAQHWFSQEMAERFIEDFPSGQFIHTIRDPISGLDSWFDWKFSQEHRDDWPSLKTRYFDTAVTTVQDLLACGWDRAHSGMADRTRAIRFEDLHLNPEATMRQLADWLGIIYCPSLLESTWNGAPYVIRVRDTSWCGPNPSSARRRSNNLDIPDRLLIFALLHDNFVAWNYPSPRAMRRIWIRRCIIVLILFIPMKMEFVTAYRVFRMQVLTSFREGRLRFACGAPIYLLKRRVRMLLVMVAQARIRLAGKSPVLTRL
jgi:hypothetical protein